MSQNPLDGRGSPSDRFLPYRGIGPTSDLSQAIGNIQNATQGQYQQPNYQPQNHQSTGQAQSYQDHDYQTPKPSSSRPKASATTPKTYWTPEADALVIKLRGTGMRWDDIAKEFPGRSAIACRLHYQNYLEKDDKWSEDRKDQLARVYAKNKEEMWAKIAQALGCSIEEAEAMHWELGEVELAKRAGAQPFSQNWRPSDRVWTKAPGDKSNEQGRRRKKFPEGS